MTQAEAVIRHQMEINVAEWLERKRVARGSAVIVALPCGNRQVRRSDLTKPPERQPRAAWRKSA